MKKKCHLNTLIAAFLLAGNAAIAEVVTFNLDPARSQVEISGNVAGFTLQSQGGNTNSLRGTFTGPIIVDLTSTSITFPGGSRMDAITNGVWRPLPGGQPGSAPADFGASVSLGLFGTGDAALRNLLMDVKSAPLTLNNSNFQGAGLVFHFLTNSGAALDYNAPVAGAGSEPLSGISTNNVATQGRVEIVGDKQDLIIPVDTTVIFSALSDNDSRVRFLGQFVGSRQLGSGPVGPTITDVDLDKNGLKFKYTEQQNLQLQATTNFSNWVNKNATKTTNGSTVEVTVPIGTALEFFRLRREP